MTLDFLRSFSFTFLFKCLGMSDKLYSMEYKIGDLIIGKVNQIRPYALFLTFEDGTNGLLHISELSDGYIRDIEKFGTVGDEIKVKVLSIDPDNGFLRVSYKAVPEKERYSNHNNSIRTVPQFDEADFTALEEKLPMWIKETLEKAKENKDD